MDRWMGEDELREVGKGALVEHGRGCMGLWPEGEKAMTT